MSLTVLVAMVRDRLTQAAVPDLPTVDALAPATTGDVPRITVSVEDAVPGFRGLGQAPAPPQHGALRVDSTVDLADPVLHLSNEDVPLLSTNRRVLQLPHGAVVREAGDDLPPFAPSDLLVRRGTTTFTPVHEPPAAGQVQLDIPSGALTFPSPLPTTGTLELGYFVGLWEVRVERFTATLLVDIAHDDPEDHAALTAAVEAAMAADAWPASAGMRTIEQTAVSAATPIVGMPAANRTRRLRFHVDVERIEPVIQTSGGEIGNVHVVIHPFEEEMEIP